MRSAVVALVVLMFIGGGAVGGYLLAERNVPISKRAMDAYSAGHYAEAVPLLKQWAQTLSVKNDGPLMGKVLTDLAEAKSHLHASDASPASQPAVAVASVAAPAALAVDPVVAQLQGQSVTLTQANTDPSTLKLRTPHAPPVPGQMLQMTIKQLGNFEFDPTTDTNVPADVKALNGIKVRLRGFMIPLTQAENITDFALVPSLVGCCFGQPPGVQHTITCATPKGQSVPYTIDEIWVEGTLKIDVQRDQGYAYSIFDLEVSSVKPLE